MKSVAAFQFLVAICSVINGTTYAAYFIGSTFEAMGPTLIPVWKSFNTLNVLACTRECVNTPGCQREAFHTPTQTCLLTGEDDDGNVTALVDPTDLGWAFYVSSQYEKQKNDTICANNTVWNNFNGSSYNVELGALNFIDASSVCIAQNGHLATIQSQAVRDFLIPLVEETMKCGFSGDNVFMSSVYVWLGANDTATEGVFGWITGDPWSYEDWYVADDHVGGPNAATEDCLVMMPFVDGTGAVLPSGGMWSDNDCLRLFPFVCEKVNEVH